MAPRERRRGVILCLWWHWYTLALTGWPDAVERARRVHREWR